MHTVHKPSRLLLSWLKPQAFILPLAFRAETEKMSNSHCLLKRTRKNHPILQCCTSLLIKSVMQCVIYVTLEALGRDRRHSSKALSCQAVTTENLKEAVQARANLKCHCNSVGDGLQGVDHCRNGCLFLPRAMAVMRLRTCVPISKSPAKPAISSKIGSLCVLPRIDNTAPARPNIPATIG